MGEKILKYMDGAKTEDQNYKLAINFSKSFLSVTF